MQQYINPPRSLPPLLLLLFFNPFNMSTIEELESLFPEDPTTPSLGLIASNGGQITLPYSTGGSGKPIAILGSGCRPSKLESDDAHAPFNAKTALSDRSLKESVRFRIEDGALSKFHKAITSSSHATAEHLSISGCGRVGGKFLGASASGRYNKAVSDNGHVRPPLPFLCYSDGSGLF